MNHEENRLETFKNWPSNANVDPRKIAKAGFYYTGQGVEVECFSCGGRISDWNYGDRPVAVITRHKMLDPACPFVCNAQASSNVPFFSNSRRVSECSQSSRISESDSSRVSESSPESSQADNECVPNSFNKRVSFRTTKSPQSCSLATSINSQGLCLQREKYHSVSARVDSFAKWPISYISPLQLAKAGFYYTGHADKVECYYCEGTIDGWEEEDVPIEEHRHRYPTCPFLLSTNHRLQFRTNCPSEFSGDYEELKGLGVHKHRIPRNPKYSSFEARLRSFKNWPPSIPQTPEQLADAGFFFTGRGDQVRCFHCDGGLRLWEAGDEPWLEHARWFSDCGFLFLVRGQHFIDEALDSHHSQQPNSMKVEPRGVKRKQPVAKLRVATEERLQVAMASPQAQCALQIGLKARQVKKALKERLELVGEMFASTEDLINAAISSQVLDEESDSEDTWGTPPNSPVVLDNKSKVSPRREVLDSRHGSPCLESQTLSQDREATDPTHNRLTSQHAVKLSPSSVTFSSCSLNESGGQPKPSSGSTRSEPVSVSVKTSSKHSVVIDDIEGPRRLKEWRQCKVCMDNEVGVVLLPCGHLVTCVACTYSLGDCPLCRQPIEATVRTFLS